MLSTYHHLAISTDTIVIRACCVPIENRTDTKLAYCGGNRTQAKGMAKMHGNVGSAFQKSSEERKMQILEALFQGRE
jgi:hypothetical protein